MPRADVAGDRTAPDGSDRPHPLRPCRWQGGSGQRALLHRYARTAIDRPHAWQRLVCPLHRPVSARPADLGGAAARRSAAGPGVMNAIALRPLASGAGVAPATFVAQATGTIVLAICAISELWCRPLGYGPKVLIGLSGSCLLPGR